MTGLEKFPGPNAGYLVGLYETYLKDPASVEPETRRFFEVSPLDLAAVELEAKKGDEAGADLRQALAVSSLARAIREMGHQYADLDPLGQRRPETSKLEPQAFELTETDRQGLPASLIDGSLAKESVSARDALARLKQVYCGKTGYEFAHLRDAQEKAWLQEAVESGWFKAPMDAASQPGLLERLTEVETFEQFLHRSFPGQRWFSLEGNDTLVLLLEEIIWEAIHTDLATLVMGMAHRGRLNVLAHIMDKPYADILLEFTEGIHRNGDRFESCPPAWMRDVKYHLGARRAIPSEITNNLDLLLLSNPSHVEMITAVALGATRSYQDQKDGTGVGQPNLEASLAVIIHGDAGFPGQGIVAESFNLGGLAGYSTRGTIHLVVNNQIGFTTGPQEAYSTLYPTDLALGYDLPVVHVNADAVEECISVARLAFAYRQRFHKDFIIDHVGYRRYGHNEGDEPSFTQALLYQAIQDHPTARAIWAGELVEAGVIKEEEAEEMKRRSLAHLQETLASLPAAEKNGLSIEVPEFPQAIHEADTGVSAEGLARLNQELHALPQGFNLNPKLERPFQRRRQALEQEGSIDWAHAEALALASILAEGTPIRLTGQDTERGTFSQRHAVLHDHRTGERFVPLQAMPSARAVFAVYNSPLSEEAALAYEYGYSVHSPEALVLWEAQFGDFVNNAQGVVDEFIVSAQAKWGQCSGLALLLPHGCEGQGPDHSSGHLERFLQLSADGNIQVAYCTTAAQYFHLLRRQARSLQSGPPRPLVVMTAKSLLRHPAASSRLQELAQGRFQPVLDDARVQEQPEAVRRVVVCSGKVFADLLASDAYTRSENSIAVVRIEELYPFPREQLSAVLSRYRQAETVVWLQEEPKNRGAWPFIAPQLQELLPPEMPLYYTGRPPRPSSAEGSIILHRSEQERIINEALSVKGEYAGSRWGGG
jgi:2-oxoglutarate dehydrogenase E1 component